MLFGGANVRGSASSESTGLVESTASSTISETVWRTIDRPRAPVVWLGYQYGPALTLPVELYHLTEDIAGHPCGSTVSRQTLEAAGFDVPSVVGAREDARNGETCQELRAPWRRILQPPLPHFVRVAVAPPPAHAGEWERPRGRCSLTELDDDLRLQRLAGRR
jgi:hypothetical protein